MIAFHFEGVHILIWVDTFKLAKRLRSMVLSRTERFFNSSSTVAYSNKGKLRVGTTRAFLDWNNEDSRVTATRWWSTFCCVNHIVTNHMSFDQTLMRINLSHTNEMLSVHSIATVFCVIFVPLHLWLRFFFLLNAAKSEITFSKVSIFLECFGT